MSTDNQMNVVYLTTGDPLYLPAMFDRVLTRTTTRTLAVFATSPLYREQSALRAAARYLRTFGPMATAKLVVRVINSKVAGRSIASVCADHQVPYHEVDDVNDGEFVERLRELKADVAVSVSCPQIFRTPLIQTPRLGILNIHGAILPHYRGVMPSFWMLANGESEAGVSIYFVNELIDAGDLCGQRVFPIEPKESLDAFLRRSKRIAADLLLETFDQLEANELVRTPLDLSDGSYYSWPSRQAAAAFRKQGRSLW